MARYQARSRPQGDGFCVGILLLDACEPHAPGDPGNASTFDFPVLYHVVPGATVERVAAADGAIAGPMVSAARELERRGVKAISSCCGYLMNYQAMVAAAVNVPVALSSLMQVPLVLGMLGPRGRIGMLVGSASRFAAMPCDDWNPEPRRIVVRGVLGDGGFAELYENERILDTELVRERVVKEAAALLDEHPDIGAILLENSAFTPCARAVQTAVGLPVFDFLSTIDLLFAATHRQERGRFF